MVAVELYSDQWVSLMSVVDPENGVNGYTYSHETRCQGRIVSILPFRVTDGATEFLTKSEITPCWGMDYVTSSITGGYEGDDIREDAVREVLEETGYCITADELIDLGTCYASKSADTLYSLFSVDLTGRQAGIASGDGSRLEELSKAIWVNIRDLLDIQDAQLHVAYNRLRNYRLAWNATGQIFS